MIIKLQDYVNSHKQIIDQVRKYTLQEVLGFVMLYGQDFNATAARIQVEIEALSGGDPYERA